MKIPIKDKANWFRDSNAGSVQCADQSVYHKYMAAHRAEEVKKKEFTTLQNEVSELKSDMGEIKSLLLTLVQNQTS